MLRASAATACAALIVAPGALASAPAPTLTANRACYINRTTAPAQMRITGSGFPPDVQISIAGGTVTAQAQTDATGAFVLTVAAPQLASPGPGTLATRLTATAPDQTTAATTRVLSTNLAVALTPSSITAREIPRRRVSFSFSGFTPGRHIYGYWLRRHVVARTRFGRAAGPCGTLTQRALLFPGGHPNARQYEVAFESLARYERRARPRVSGRLSILGP